MWLSSLIILCFFINSIQNLSVLKVTLDVINFVMHTSKACAADFSASIFFLSRVNQLIKFCVWIFYKLRIRVCEHWDSIAFACFHFFFLSVLWFAFFMSFEKLIVNLNFKWHSKQNVRFSLAFWSDFTDDDLDSGWKSNKRWVDDECL